MAIPCLQKIASSQRTLLAMTYSEGCRKVALPARDGAKESEEHARAKYAEDRGEKTDECACAAAHKKRSACESNPSLADPRPCAQGDSKHQRARCDTENHACIADWVGFVRCG